jgi:hypothetical protein
MLMTCANPDCSVSFHEGGRFFRFRLGADSKQVPQNAHSVQHFWLCEACSGLYTLEYRKDNSVVLRTQMASIRSNAFMRVIRADGI